MLDRMMINLFVENDSFSDDGNGWVNLRNPTAARSSRWIQFFLFTTIVKNKVTTKRCDIWAQVCQSYLVLR